MAVSASDKIRRFYSQFNNNDHVLIFINADPDALACAMAIKRLLWRKVARVVISNVNIMKRPDNLAMVRLLGIELIHINKVSINDFTRLVMVDSQPDHHERFASLEPDVIIDHHPETYHKAPFSDIRPEYGATATIMTEYLKAAKIKPSARLATGLLYAIKTDTGNFERRTIMEDVRAFQFLYHYANLHLAQRMEQGEIRSDFLKYFEYALKNRRMRKGRIFVHLGDVVNPDVCVIIADFFMRVDTARWSIVSGKYAKKLIVIFRNDGFQKDAGKIAKKAFGSMGTAGGHKSAARAEIPFSAIEDSVNLQDDSVIQQWIMQRVKKGPEEQKQKP